MEDFTAGWGVIMCTGAAMTDIQGVGSMFPVTNAT